MTVSTCRGMGVITLNSIFYVAMTYESVRISEIIHFYILYIAPCTIIVHHK